MIIRVKSILVALIHFKFLVGYLNLCYKNHIDNIIKSIIPHLFLTLYNMVKKMQDMTLGHPLKLIVKFSIPLLIGNIFQQLYSISDIIIVGRLIGIKALAAVGVAAPLFFMLVAVSIGFTNGLTVITAQRFGAKDYRSMRKSVTTATILSTLFTITAGLVMLVSLDGLFKIMNVPEEISADGKKFISIISYGVIMIVGFNLLSGFLRALGDSKTPLYFLIAATLLNIAFNIFFIYHIKMGVAGSALGTVCAMSISVFCCLIYIVKKCPILRPRKGDWKLNWEFSKQHLKIAIPMAIQFSIIALSSTIIQSVCNSFGPDTIAAFTSAMRVEQLATQPMVTFGIAMATYIAQNYGAGMIGRIRRGVFECSMVSLTLSIILAIIMYVYGTDIVGIFVSEEHHNVIEIARTYLHISILFYFFLGQIFIFRNTLQGMGNAIIPMISSFVELLLRTFAAIVLAVKFGYLGICYAGPIAWVGGAAVVSFGYFYIIRQIGHRCLVNHSLTVAQTNALTK